MPRVPRSIVLFVALLLYGACAFGAAREVGWVGEVVASWAGAPPEVLVRLAPPSDAAHQLGPLVARQTRPWEGLSLAGVELPLAVNSYTGGPPDWPAWMATRVFGDPRAGLVLNVALGALLLALAHRFFRFHGPDMAAGAAALLLATDWCFVFYKKVLGGTEILLQAAGLLLLWALWSRRWRGGTHGTVAIALGVGLGLLAKGTFAATIVAFGIAALLTRWDQPPMRPPAAVRPPLLVAIVLLCLTPLLLANLHHALGPGDLVPSHDTLGVQLGRLGQGGGGREGVRNLWWFLQVPVASFETAWKTVAVEELAPLRWPTFGAALVGTVLCWRDRSHAPSSALLRLLSLALPLQVGALFLANHDLHHLAQASVTLALWTGAGCARLASTLGPPRSGRRALATLLFVAPAMVAGASQLFETDTIVRTSRVPLFTRAGQEALVELLRRADVRRVITSDYEVYGVLEAMAPDLDVVHTWGAVARKERDPAVILGLTDGGAWLTLRAAAPFIYNLRPRPVPGARRVDALSDGEEWAELWVAE